RGQAFELAVSASLTPEPAELRRGFEELHEERYGYTDPDQELELVTLRVSAFMPGAEVSLTQARGECTRGRRRAVLDGEEQELDVLRGTPEPGTEVTGPAVVELPESTLLVAPGWSGEVDETGTIHVRRDGPG
ncbi:MAG: hydantoinase/oxoprolinase family protein, partial [Solirubrobacteraceae bacterium]